MENKIIDWNRPTRDNIEQLDVGSLAPDCFGQLKPITRIYAMGENIHEKKYICYYVQFSENATISQSLTEGEIVHIV